MAPDNTGTPAYSRPYDWPHGWSLARQMMPRTKTRLKDDTEHDTIG
jgi:hypothetical protein